MSNAEKCASCNKYVIKVSPRKTIVTSQKMAEFLTQYLKSQIVLHDVLCNNCRIKAYKNKKTDSACDNNNENDVIVESSVSSSFDDPDFNISLMESAKDDVIKIEVPIKRTVATHKYCFICNDTKNIHVIPFEARLQIYIKIKIYVPKGNRCCRKHLIKNKLYNDELKHISIYSHFSSIEPVELQQLLNSLAITCDSTLFDKIGDFNMPEEQLFIFTGLTWENIIELKTMLISMKNSASRNVTQAIIIFLFKLRSGNANETIASIFQLEHKQLVSDYSNAVMNAFDKDVLPLKFGLKSATREYLINNHTSNVAKSLYDIDNKLLLICDDGYIVDILGPYYATQNDVSIMKEIMTESNGLCNLMKKGDIFILDRGFRDVKNMLTEQGYGVLMPALKGKRPQLSTTESNDSRFVTKLRWVVEAIHGILKQKYRLLDRKLDNKMLPKIGIYCKIASFLQNRYGKRLNSDAGRLDIIAQMKEKKNQENSLSEEIEKHGWSRKKLIFSDISTSDIFDFPEMTENDLHILFTGSYQFSQAISYLAEILNADGSITAKYVKERTGAIFNEGFSSTLKTTEALDITIGKHCKRFTDSRDEMRLNKAEFRSLQRTKETRTVIKMKRTLQQELFEEEEGLLYGPGIAD
ncbi:uncharacterized protein LOC122404392 [Colletes gigas]|uniref:uncharacterized protein LOC122404392 n=1 Tax=Colletes gigas TaxID=935657 RepID=UPI001C9A2E43|nr:uncharacterized protein LOC122404392 [Colletes gigas]